MRQAGILFFIHILFAFFLFLFHTISDEFRIKLQEYIKVLEDIKLNCCISNYFIYDQTNRISKLIYDKYFENYE